MPRLNERIKVIDWHESGYSWSLSPLNSVSFAVSGAVDRSKSWLYLDARQTARDHLITLPTVEQPSA